jgi:hypothetical protein
MNGRFGPGWFEKIREIRIGFKSEKGDGASSMGSMFSDYLGVKDYRKRPSHVAAMPPRFSMNSRPRPAFSNSDRQKPTKFNGVATQGASLAHLKCLYFSG